MGRRRRRRKNLIDLFSVFLFEGARAAAAAGDGSAFCLSLLLLRWRYFLSRRRCCCSLGVREFRGVCERGRVGERERKGFEVKRRGGGNWREQKGHSWGIKGIFLSCRFSTLLLSRVSLGCAKCLDFGSSDIPVASVSMLPLFWSHLRSILRQSVD